MASFSSVQTVAPTTTQPSSNNLPSSGDALLLVAAFAGAATTKAARKQYRKAMRKMAWSSLTGKFRKQNSYEQRVGKWPLWAFILIVALLAAIGVWLFGFLGFIIILGLGVIIYLLVND